MRSLTAHPCQRHRTPPPAARTLLRCLLPSLAAALIALITCVPVGCLHTCRCTPLLPHQGPAAAGCSRTRAPSSACVWPSLPQGSTTVCLLVGGWSVLQPWYPSFPQRGAWPPAPREAIVVAPAAAAPGGRGTGRCRGWGAAPRLSAPRRPRQGCLRSLMESGMG